MLSLNTSPKQWSTSPDLMHLCMTSSSAKKHARARGRIGLQRKCQTNRRDPLAHERYRWSAKEGQVDQSSSYQHELLPRAGKHPQRLKARSGNTVRDNCAHLSATDREKLLSMLLKFEPLFSGTLGDWNLPPVSFDIKEGMKPYHGRAYPIPKIHKATLMKEIDRLCSIGVLKWQPNSQWALPTFIIPKKDGTVRTISDFWELNKRIIQKPYPIPKISTTLQELEGFTYVTALDLNMGYYTIRLDAKASEICTIIFPWRKYSYNRLPMGFGGSADIFQAQGVLITSLAGRCPFLLLRLLFIWQVLQDFVIERMVFRMPFQYIAAFIISSRRACPGCCR